MLWRLYSHHQGEKRDKDERQQEPGTQDPLPKIINKKIINFLLWESVAKNKWELF